MKQIQRYMCYIPIFVICMGALSPPAMAAGNVNVFLGGKFLDENDWEPVEKQLEGGLLVDFGGTNWPVNLAVDLLYSSGEDSIFAMNGFNVTSLHLEGSTAEIDVGLRKNWGHAEKGFVSLGGGFAVIQATVKGDFQGNSASDDDVGYGGWISAGAVSTFSQKWNIGIHARWSKAEVTIGTVTGEAGGFHGGLLAGYHWE